MVEEEVFPESPLPVWSGPNRSRDGIVANIRDWIDSAAMARLLDVFGAEPARGDTAERLTALAEFSARTWDFRRGARERWEIVAAGFTPEVDVAVRQATAALGLNSRARPSGHYRHALVLGGGPASATARFGLLTRLIGAGACSVAAVSGLASFRPSTDPEKLLAKRLQFGDCPTEFDSVAGALADGPFTDRVQQTPTGQVTIREFAHAVPRRFVVAAVPGAGQARANTTDTLVCWAENLGPLTPADRVLVVTTDLYVPFQHCAAVRAVGLRYCCEVETIGVDSAELDPSVRGGAQTEKLLQEVNSAIRELRELYAACTAN